MGVQVRIKTVLLNGRRVGKIVGMKTLDSDATLQEAIDYGFITGKKELAKSHCSGVMKSMIDGLGKDGNGRKVDGVLSIQPWPTGRLDDICDDIDPAQIEFIARARMLKEFRPDTSGWTYIIEGSTGSLDVSVITTGERIGVINLGEDVQVNGRELAMGEGDTISWRVPETGATGMVNAAYVTSESSRITIDSDGLEELFDAANDGKDVVFTFVVGGRKAVKAATMKYVG